MNDAWIAVVMAIMSEPIIMIFNTMRASFLQVLSPWTAWLPGEGANPASPRHLTVERVEPAAGREKSLQDLSDPRRQRARPEAEIARWGALSGRFGIPPEAG